MSIDLRIRGAPFRALTVAALLGFAAAGLFLAGNSQAASRADSRDPARWNEFVVGSVSDLPEHPIKKFLESSHFRNAHGDDIAELTHSLGPFAPDANRVFWIPTIDMPLSEENWRFLSTFQELPEAILHNATYVRDGRSYVRMFLHPYTTENPTFKRLAEAHGGFKFEFQGATTASVRSFVAWRTSAPKPENGPGRIDFPKDSPEKFLWPKVSVFKTNIQGSRLNPLKKLVRAHEVTELMGLIPPETKEAVGFGFSGEHIVAVPSGTDAGFVVREVLPEYLGHDAASVEPAFAIFHREKLEELTRGLDDVDRYIAEKLFRPISRAVSYLLMEEGMMGEYHTQNMSLPVNRRGRTLDRVLLHDADAFRTSILLRALNGKDLSPLRQVETPFYFMKDSMFRVRGSAASDAINLNALLDDYLVSTQLKMSPTGAVLDWCRAKAARYPKKWGWCTGPRLRKLFRAVLAEELSPYLGRSVSASELRYGGRDSGSVGLVKLFQERVELLSSTSSAVQGAPDPRLQRVLGDEFQRLYAIGSGGGVSRDFSAETTQFLLDARPEGSFISALRTRPDGTKSLKGVALLGTAEDPEAVRFAGRVRQLAGIELQLGDKVKPVLKDIGGGSNRLRRPPEPGQPAAAEAPQFRAQPSRAPKRRPSIDSDCARDFRDVAG